MHYFVHSEAFLKERQRKLDEYLRLLTSYDYLTDDKELTSFLFNEDFKSPEVPYSQKLKKFLNSMPSLNQLSYDRDTFNAYSKLLLNSTQKVDEEKLGIQLKINRREVEDGL